MAKRLLGKEVTAALNERIIAQANELKAKGVEPTLCIIRVGENESDISYERGATKPWALPAKRFSFRRQPHRKKCWQLLIR